MRNSYNDYFSEFSYKNPHVISYRNKRRGELVGKVIVLMLIIGVISLTSLARYASPLLGIPVFLVLAGLLFKPWRLFDRRFAGRIVSIAHEHCRESINKSPVDIRYVNQHVVAYVVCLVKGERRKNYCGKKSIVKISVGSFAFFIPCVLYFYKEVTDKKPYNRKKHPYKSFLLSRKELCPAPRSLRQTRAESLADHENAIRTQNTARTKA